MTTHELIDRLKTAKNKNDNAFVIVRYEKDKFVARHVSYVLEIDGDTFIELYGGELHVSNVDFTILKPNRKEEA